MATRKNSEEVLETQGQQFMRQQDHIRNMNQYVSPLEQIAVSNDMLKQRQRPLVKEITDDINRPSASYDVLEQLMKAYEEFINRSLSAEVGIHYPESLARIDEYKSLLPEERQNKPAPEPQYIFHKISSDMTGWYKVDKSTTAFVIRMKMYFDDIANEDFGICMTPYSLKRAYTTTRQKITRSFFKTITEDIPTLDDENFGIHHRAVYDTLLQIHTAITQNSADDFSGTTDDLEYHLTDCIMEDYTIVLRFEVKGLIVSTLSSEKPKPQLNLNSVFGSSNMLMI